MLTPASILELPSSGSKTTQYRPRCISSTTMRSSFSSDTMTAVFPHALRVSTMISLLTTSSLYAHPSACNQSSWTGDKTYLLIISGGIRCSRRSEQVHQRCSADVEGDGFACRLDSCQEQCQVAPCSSSQLILVIERMTVEQAKVSARVPRRRADGPEREETHEVSVTMSLVVAAISSQCEVSSSAVHFARRGPGRARQLHRALLSSKRCKSIIRAFYLPAFFLPKDPQRSTAINPSRRLAPLVFTVP